jgi:hypothetical protein
MRRFPEGSCLVRYEAPPEGSSLYKICGVLPKGTALIRYVASSLREPLFNMRRLSKEATFIRYVAFSLREPP